MNTDIGARRAPSRRALVAGLAAAIPVAALSPSLAALAQPAGSPHALFDLWRAFQASNRAQAAADAALETAEDAALADYPTPPNLIRVVKRDSDGAIVDEWVLTEDEIRARPMLLPPAEAQALVRRRLAALRTWKAACAAVDARHGVPALHAALERALDDNKALIDALGATPATDLLGLQVKLAYLAEYPDADVARTACAEAARLTGLHLAAPRRAGAA